MILQDQVNQFLKDGYKRLILSQITETYSGQNVVLNITLKLDLSKILRNNRLIGTALISQFPAFQDSAKKTVAQFIRQKGLNQPQHGIHLIIKVTNCPLPIQNINSTQFQIAGFEQTQGIMIYLKDLLVTDVSQHQVFLFSATEVWTARCNCKDDPIYRTNFSRSLISFIKYNSTNEDKLKHLGTSEAYRCQTCSKEYTYMCRQNQIFLNCQKIRCLLPKRTQKEALFEKRDFIAYGQLSLTDGIKAGSIISCCSYLFLRPTIVKSSAKQPLVIKSQYSAFLINVNLHLSNSNLLTIRPENIEFFSQIGSLGLNQKYCQSLTNTNVLLQNYQNLVQSVDKFRFSYIPPSMLTTLKLSLLNSICSHHSIQNQSKNLHVCLITQDLQLAFRLMYISGLNIKRWPSQYDINNLLNWLKSCRGCIVIVVCPNKKDLQFLQQYFGKKLDGLDNLSITFWLLCEINPRKQINIDYFGIVLDMTTQKNILICKQAIQQSIDLKLSAFIIEEFDICPPTIAKVKNPKSRFMLTEKFQNPLTQAQIQFQEAESKNILQSYYLKCRDLKKTSSITLSHLYQLAQGFSYLRSGLKSQNWVQKQHETKLSILDSVLAIFLDQQSARNKFTSSNTIFGAQISKLILNQQQCQLSFWDFISQDDGTLTEQKNYMPKSEMFKRMLLKLNQLLFEDEIILRYD